MEFEPNLYEELGIDTAYTIKKQEDGISNWSAYVATGYIADFDQLMTDEESE